MGRGEFLWSDIVRKAAGAILQEVLGQEATAESEIFTLITLNFGPILRSRFLPGSSACQ